MQALCGTQFVGKGGLLHFFFPLYKREENFSDYSFMKERKIIVSMVSILSGVRVTRIQVLSGFWRRAFDHGKRFFPFYKNAFIKVSTAAF